MTSLSSNWVKRPKASRYHVWRIEGSRKIEINIWWNFKAKSLFLRWLFQNIAVSTHAVTSLTQNWVKKSPKLYFMYKYWKMKVNSKGKLEVKYSFIKPLSQNLKFWLLVVTSSIQKWVKKVQIGTSCTNDDRKMKVKSKRCVEATALSKFWNFDSTW